MLFSSYIFIFCFLPITLVGLFYTQKFYSKQVSILWLIACSLFFYGWWNPKYIFLLLTSILVNYLLAKHLKSPDKRYNKRLLSLGVIGNLSLLGYYKYTNFFIETLNYFSEDKTSFSNIILPLAISFFTFQQIGYLVDSYRNKTKPHDFVEYLLFITFFPQLIAGPIVHHSEFIPQLKKKTTITFTPETLAVGLSIFQIGLFKKVVLAGFLQNYTDPLFSAVEAGRTITFIESWGFCTLYTFQNYFDFSAYSDMAIGLALIIGFKLPLNFNSPCKATNLRIFWRRWHMTLFRFLRDYIYAELKRNPFFKRFESLNVLCIFLASGLWHGASWTFVMWGAISWFYIVVAHFLRMPFVALFGNKIDHNVFYIWICRIVTFFSLITISMMFRAESMSSIKAFSVAMTSDPDLKITRRFSGILINPDMALIFSRLGISITSLEFLCILIFIGMFIIWFLPNTIQLFSNYTRYKFGKNLGMEKIPTEKLVWQPSLPWAILISLMSVLSILNIATTKSFIYFQF